VAEPVAPIGETVGRELVFVPATADVAMAVLLAPTGETAGRVPLLVPALEAVAAAVAGSVAVAALPVAVSVR